MSDQSDPRPLSPKEAAKQAGKSTDQIYRAIRAGRLPAERVGGSLTIDPAALERAFGSEAADRRDSRLEAERDELTTKLKAAERRISELEADRIRDSDLVRSLQGFIEAASKDLAASRQTAIESQNPKRRFWRR